jgi:5-hydroxyisourate hydrolase
MTGKPAAGLEIALVRIDELDHEMHVISAITNSDGRVDKPLLDGDDFICGTYRLDFYAGDYLNTQDRGSDFLDIIPIRFTVSDTSRHYHVPLLLSAFGYSTYRGS